MKDAGTIRWRSNWPRMFHFIIISDKSFPPHLLLIDYLPALPIHVSNVIHEILDPYSDPFRNSCFSSHTKEDIPNILIVADLLFLCLLMLCHA